MPNKEEINKEEIKKAEKELKELTGGFLPSDTYVEILKKHNIPTVEGIKIKDKVKDEIKSGKISSSDVKDRLIGLLVEYTDEQDKDVETETVKNIISIPEEYEGYATGILIEDGGYKNMHQDMQSNLVKSADISTEVFIKIEDDRITLIDNIDPKFGGIKRLIFFKDIVLLNIGYKERVRSEKDITQYQIMKYEYDLADNYEHKRGVELSLINGINFKIVFDDRDKEELLFNKWVAFKENQ